MGSRRLDQRVGAIPAFLLGPRPPRTKTHAAFSVPPALALPARGGNIAPMTRRQLRANLTAGLIGLAATLSVLAAYVAGGLERLELITLDLRYRYCNSIPQRDDIVCIDIDDSTLETVGRWPWARDKQAALIAVPADLGARAILVDLTWGEREPFRTEPPPAADVWTDPLTIDPAAAETRFPDYELRAAIAEAGNVYLAYEYRIRAPESSDEFNAAVDLLLKGQRSSAQAQLRALLARRRAQTGTTSDADDRDLAARAAAVAALESNPALSGEELLTTARLRRRQNLDPWLDRCRIAALERRARRWLAEKPQRCQRESWELLPELYAEIFGQPIGGDTPLGRALDLALWSALGYQATTRAALVPLEVVVPVAEPVDGIAPAHPLLARAARRCGFVVFEPDTDGVVRRMPLFARHRGNALVQVAFALACDQLGVTPDGISVRGRTLRLRTPNGPRDSLTIQLDSRGRTLIPWVPQSNWVREQFTHLPADALWSLHEHRQSIAHNRRLIAAALGDILSRGLFGGMDAERRTLADIARLEADVRTARYRGLLQEAALLRGHLEQLRGQLGQIESRLRAELRTLEQQHDAGRANPPAADLAFCRAQLELIDRCRETNRRLEATAAEIAERIRAVVEGNICLIGYTASSLPDMKPIPTSRSAAGVMAHANLLNGLLSGRLVRWTPRWVNVALATACGALGTLIGLGLRPRTGLWLVTFLTVSYVLVAGAAGFYKYTYWVALTPAVSALLLPFVGIAAYRYVFIEGERRQLATALGQYTSRQIAEQVAENPELCRRAEMREVTAMFTDLKDFTGLSERIGAERTQHLLNACLGRFTEVMLEHEALVNKFIGDGIFAFWNPVIYPQPDHARRACTAAVELNAALARLRAEQREHGGDPAFEQLVLRVGIATGRAIVGPCGSEQKYDYTCIGDSVNVAARLESANKFYGTRILVSEATQAQAADAFEFRPLGRVRVKGKTQTVPIFELLGRRGDVEPAALQYARLFGEAVARFQRRDWPAASTAFEACRQQRPNDPAVSHYLAAAARFLDQPPGDEWDGAIELAEK